MPSSNVSLAKAVKEQYENFCRYRHFATVHLKIITTTKFF